MVSMSKYFFRALPVHPDLEIRNYLTNQHYIYKEEPLEGGVESKCASDKRWGPYMVLTSKKKFGALWFHLDLNIRKKGSPSLEIRMNQEGSEFCFTY